MKLHIVIIFEMIIAVRCWQCGTPISRVYSRVNSNAVLQFSADLTNLNSPRNFALKYFDGTAKATIRYNADKTFITDTVSGVSISGDSAGNVAVTFENVQESSSGTYLLSSSGLQARCSCMYILGVPSKPSITTNLVTPFVGQTVIITCSSSSTTVPGNHSLSLTYNWNVDSIDNPNDTKYSYSYNRNKLTVSNIAREDANKQFTCTATENVSGGYVSGNSEFFSFAVYYGPDSASVNVTSPYVVTEGELMSIGCTADCKPGCTYTWINITSGEEVNAGNDILYIESVNKYMTGGYQCKATNDHSSYSKFADVIVSINIKERTLVQLFYVGNNVSQSMVIVNEHDVDIRFTCVVSGDPAVNVKVMFNDEVLQEQHDTNNLTYTITTASCFNSGEYECVGINEKQEISHRHISLFVRCSPRPLRKTQGNITSLLDTPVTLAFVALAYPMPGPNEFTWFKQIGTRWTQVLSNEDYKIYSSGLESNLTILSVSKADFGQYRVSVENSIGSYDQYIFLSEQNLDPICLEVSNKENNCGSIIAIAIVFGVISFVVTTYATSLTIIWKRNASMNNNQRTTEAMEDTDSGGDSNRQKIYANVAYTTNDQDIQGQLSCNADSKVVGEDVTSKTQYTALDNFSREKGDNLYDAIKKD